MVSEESSTPKLLMLSPRLSPNPPGLSTPPHQTSASVPFLWEEEPGKPRPCTALVTLPHHKCLELPPRLQPLEHSRLITKTPSPTTVLDGPYVAKSVAYSSSFRIFSRSKRYDSFDYRSSGRFSPERVQIGALFGNEKKGRKGLFGHSKGQMHKSKKVLGTKLEFCEEGSSVISPSWDDVSQFAEEEDEKEGDNSGTPIKVKMTNLSHAKSHFWMTMREGIKHAIPWKSRKSKKQVHIV
ncbi:uncharacterized protein At4g00950 [Daucus carota subsp. sativus]|uniref:Uncharacterized protein n=1 Tax=Daucus carota subsp. sativus TaxID=79200 RepID=A0A164TZ24_DAUCS|nr:PREDICTED: uncharacterized protein At4g00950-like [Daucus carota subsp. sativus]